MVMTAAKIFIGTTRPGYCDLEHNADNISCGATACSRSAPARPPQSTVDEKARSPATCITAGQRASLVLHQIVELRGLESLTLTLPVLFYEHPDQRKRRTGMSAGAVHCRSKPSHVVQLFRLLQICSTHRSVNSANRFRIQPPNTRPPRAVWNSTRTGSAAA